MATSMHETRITEIDGLVDRAVRSLTDASRNNPLLYYRQSSSTRFTLPPLGSEFISKLLAGSDLIKTDFAPMAERFASEVKAIASGSDSDGPDSADDGNATKPERRQRATKNTTPLQSRLQKMRAKARENEEERGLQTLFAAVGFVTWDIADGGRPPCAPLFLLPMEIVEDKSSRGDFVVHRVADGEIVFNRAILAVAPIAFREIAADLFEGGVVDDVPAAYERVAAAVAQSRDAVRLDPSGALGIFNYAMMAVVTDLDESRDELAEHIIIRALAGDAEARDVLARAREGAVELGDLDVVKPPDEPFVLDADPWQASTIQTLRRFENSHATIDGPPGTGKSQTIANLIASLIAQGKSVLFCCEKRAALDVVKRRLASAGLEHLVLDLHGAGVTRQRAYAQLKRARLAVSQAALPNATLDPILEVTRATLVEHERFMHTPGNGQKLTPYEIVSALAALPKFDFAFRLDAASTARLGDMIVSVENDVAEAAKHRAFFLHDSGVTWSASENLDSEHVSEALNAVDSLGATLDGLRTMLSELGLPQTTRSELNTTLELLRTCRANLKTCRPAVCAIDRSTAELAAKTLESPFRALLQRMPGRRRDAVRLITPCIGSLTGRVAAKVLREMTGLEDLWRSKAVDIAAQPQLLDDLCNRIDEEMRIAEKWLAFSLPDDLTETRELLATCVRGRDGAYRVARTNEIKERLKGIGLGALIAEFSSIDPSLWPAAVRYVYLQSALEPYRPALTRFDGRTHDSVVVRFADLEKRLRATAADRVRRSAAENFISIDRKFRGQTTALGVQLERVRSKKPLRKLFDEVPNALLGLAPCVMASPLTVSQFLPRRTLFDIVIFDEGSQMAPESAIAAILRGARVVIAGDDRQLPPTNFFATVAEEDDVDEDERDATAGTESVLNALRPFTKPLGLRVHYRSRDERLIAFSNHYLYDDGLITFPGSGEPSAGINFVHVDPSGSEADENSSTPEVAAVVRLIVEHAEHHPEVTLGVIALGSTHATRIETYLADVRRTRPDLDTFFDDTKPDPFFVKNLERVQGDERDAIILTVGYGRTKTGAVSHNFGPINRQGGERRLNVAVTRAKCQMTLVSTFRKADLNPLALNSTGAKLLASYLGYAESNGRDLGRDGADPSVAPSGIEQEVQQALERRLGTTLMPQYGVGKFRIDLAVQHPREPGRFVLAVEFDGASYHSSPTARLRDRQRQHILEAQGWTFCRIWSTDWFNDREAELIRVDAMFRKAMAAEERDVEHLRQVSPPDNRVDVEPPLSNRQGSCPVKPPNSIVEVSDAELQALLRWIGSDGCLRTDDELFSEMQKTLRFARRGARIVERFNTAIRNFRKA